MPGSGQMMEVVLDMETSDPDDFLCLIFLASHPRVRLKAVTLVPGSAEQVGLVRWLLHDALDYQRDEVAVGASKLGWHKPSVSPWHARAFFKKHIPLSSEAEPAANVLLRECNEQTVLVTGAALSNVAAAIDLDGGFAAGLLLAQGGFAGCNIVPADAVLPKFAGRTTMHTFNFGADNAAADTVQVSD